MFAVSEPSDLQDLQHGNQLSETIGIRYQIPYFNSLKFRQYICKMKKEHSRKNTAKNDIMIQTKKFFSISTEKI